MGAWRTLTAGVAVAVAFPGCGSGGDNSSSTTGSSSASSSTTAASSATSGIRSHLLTGNELAGFHVADVLVKTTPNGWVSGEQVPPDQAASEKAMLERDGFRVAVHEDLTNGSAGGASIVLRFRSPQAAADAFGFYLRQFKAGNPASAGAYQSFRVTGIPHAVGFSIGGIAGGINIVFHDGAYWYLVGQEGGSKARIAKLNAAARHLYHRVHS